MNKKELNEANKEELEEKIKKHFHSFSKGFRKVAEYVLAEKENIPFNSALSIGKKVGVSESTVLRFVKFIGYNGYPDLQNDLIKWIKRNINPLQKLRDTSRRGRYENVYNNILDNDINHITSLKKNLSLINLAKVNELIIKARKKYILGSRTSYAIAYLFSFLLGRILKDVTLLEMEDPNFFKVLSQANQKDVLIAISFPRYSQHTFRLAQLLKKKRCKLIGITDRIISPIGQIADLIIEVNSSSPTYFNSFTAVISVINCIVEGVSLKHFGHSMASLRDVEKIIGDFDILVF